MRHDILGVVLEWADMGRFGLVIGEQHPLIECIWEEHRSEMSRIRLEETGSIR